MSNKLGYKMGWIPDYPDIRDYTTEHDRITPLIRKINIKDSKSIPSSFDLREWCSPVENQQDIGACTAHAVAGVVEYFENKSFGKYIDCSRLFLYKVTRNLLHLTGDTGAFLRSAIGALVLFGMPPEEYCPYDTSHFDDEPLAFCYAFAQNFKCINYFRHDPPGLAPKKVLQSVKKYIAAGIPSVFGFTVYDSIKASQNDGCIPFPHSKEKLLGGHAVAAFGYDDAKVITHPSNGSSTTGAILIRNSWGSEWGDNGYGWLPYEYILKGIAVDWWSILKQDWVDTGVFMNE